MEKKEAGVMVKAHDELDKYLTTLKDVTTFTDCPEVDYNVFTCLLSDIIVKQDVKKGYTSKSNIDLTNSSTGEIIQMNNRTIFYKKQYVDNDTFIKFYTDGIKRWFDLSHGAYKVFGYFINELQKTPNSDIVHFSLQDCMDMCGYRTHPMVYKALTELIQKEFICKSSKYKLAFFINPRNIYNGGRISIYEDLINKDNPPNDMNADEIKAIEDWNIKKLDK